jgi:putative serine protease PepD
MDPAGPGRVRGFRAPTAEEAARNAAAESAPAPPTAELTQPPGQVSRGSGWRWALAAAAVLLVAMVIIAALAFRLGSSSAGSAAKASAAPTPTAAKTAAPLPVTDLYRLVVPSVALITTAKGSLGSGAIVTDAGAVLTAHHVVSDGSRISVVFSDGT